MISTIQSILPPLKTPIQFGLQPVSSKKYKMPSVTDTFVYQGKNGEPDEKTTVQSLIGGGQIFGKVDQMLKGAQSTVMVDLYNFQTPKLYPERSSPKGTPGANIQAGLLDKLIALHRKGVKIKIIIDNHWDKQFKEGHNNRTIAELRKAGIDVVTYPEFSKINHVKVLIVDNKYAMIGGMNWGNHSATNHDAAVFIEGPDVHNIYNTIFKDDWLSSGRDASEIPNVPDFEPGRVKVLQTAARESSTGAKDEIFHEILNQIQNAEESIHAELFVLTQKLIVEELIAAHRRLTAAGKEGVKILVDPGLFFSFPNCRPGIQRLAKAGVPIRFYQTNREAEEKLHAKWAVFDKKRLIIGSANWSNVGLLTNIDPKDAVDVNDDGNLERISRGNHEVALLIESKKLGNTFANQVMFDMNHFSFPILEFRDGKWRPVQPKPGNDAQAALPAAS